MSAQSPYAALSIPAGMTPHEMRAAIVTQLENHPLAPKKAVPWNIFLPLLLELIFNRCSPKSEPDAFTLLQEWAQKMKRKNKDHCPLLVRRVFDKCDYKTKKAQDDAFYLLVNHCCSSANFAVPVLIASANELGEKAARESEAGGDGPPPAE